MKKVYIFNELNRSSEYGIGTYVSQLVECLKDCSDIFCNVIMLNSEEKEFVCEKKETYSIYYIPKLANTNNSSEKYYRNVFYFIATNIIDDVYSDLIFHLNYLWEYDLIYYIRKFYPGSKIVFTIHHQQWAFALCGNIELYKRIIEKSTCDELTVDDKEYILNGHKLELDFYKSVDKIIVLSDFTKRILLEIYAIEENKISCIYNGLPDAYLPISVDEKISLRHKYLFNEEEKLILYVGRLDEIKGISFLIEAFKRVLKIYPNSYLLLVGEGDYSKCLRDSSNYWRRIIFTGYLEKNILYDMYRIADIGILFSFHEQCSFSAIEMMMFDLPIISTDSTGLKEMFPEKYRCSVHYCNSKSYLSIEECVDKIVRLLGNKNDHSMRTLYLSNYTLAKMRERMILLYKGF